MTVTSSTTRAYADADTTSCGDCGTDLQIDEAHDCGTHTMCRSCLHDSPCRGCRDLAASINADARDEWDYKATREDNDDV